MSHIWPILVSTAVSQVLGALWFSPLLFARVWMREVGLTESQIKASPSKMPFVVALAAALVLAVGISLIHAALNPESTWGSLGNGLWVGLVTGIGISAAATAPHYAFSGRSRLLFLIDQGHSLAKCVLTSMIIALWPQ